MNKGNALPLFISFNYERNKSVTFSFLKSNLIGILSDSSRNFLRSAALRAATSSAIKAEHLEINSCRNIGLYFMLPIKLLLVMLFASFVFFFFLLLLQAIAISFSLLFAIAFMNKKEWQLHITIAIVRRSSKQRYKMDTKN